MEPKPIAGVDLSEEVGNIGHSLPHQLWIEKTVLLEGERGRARVISCNTSSAVEPDQPYAEARAPATILPSAPHFKRWECRELKVV